MRKMDSMKRISHKDIKDNHKDARWARLTRCLFGKFQRRALARIQEQPYSLALCQWGIFNTATDYT